METLLDKQIEFVVQTDAPQETQVKPFKEPFTPKDQLAKKYKGSGDPVGDGPKDDPNSAENRSWMISQYAYWALTSIEEHESRIGSKGS